MIRAGATAQNFYHIKIESPANVFASVGNIDSLLIPLISEVEKKIGVVPDYEKNLALVNAIYAEINNWGKSR